MTQSNEGKKLDLDKLTMAEFIKLASENEELTKDMKINEIFQCLEVARKAIQKEKVTPSFKQTKK